MRRPGLVLAALIGAGGVAAAAMAATAATSTGPRPPAAAPAPPPAAAATRAVTTTTAVSTTTAAPTTTTTLPPPTTAAPAALPVPVPASAPALAGCPPPPPPPPPPPTPGSPPPAPPPAPWHPTQLIPDAEIPAEAPPAPWTSDATPIVGKGMWVWQLPRTEGGDVNAIVAKAAAAGLHQLWVRVGDSQAGFYAQWDLDLLVPAAHRAGISVLGWGFPYLYDPVADAVWSLEALAWTAPDGQRLDGFSADIERPSEGVDLSASRVAAYLATLREGAGDRLIVATVYPPTNGNWYGDYPYTVMARYVDAFAPMIYWECTDPAADTTLAVARLATLHRPVHVIGQAFSNADIGGRVPPPSAAETEWFLHSAQRDGATGASLWVWQSATADEWAAIAGYGWPG